MRRAPNTLQPTLGGALVCNSPLSPGVAELYLALGSMTRVAKIALLVVFASFGVLFTFAGARLWRGAYRTTSTIFERTSGGEDDAAICGNIDLIDKSFVLQRTGAAVVFLFGVSTALWAGVSVLKERRL
jgi:hypothetical protein